MKTIKLVDGKKSKFFLMPSSFEDMSEDHFMSYVALTEGNISEESFWEKWGINAYWQEKLPVESAFKLKEIVEFLSELDKAKCSKIFVSKMKSLHATRPRLADVSLQQFMAIDSYFSYYNCTIKEEFLDKMLACVYLKKKEGFVINSTHKQLVNIEVRERLFSEVPFLDKKALYINWILIKNWLASEFRYLFPRGEASENAKPQPVDWLKIFYSFVGDNIPHMEYYQAMPCMVAFEILNNKIQQQNEREK